jgi:YD repeat-containing protein
MGVNVVKTGDNQSLGATLSTVSVARVDDWSLYETTIKLPSSASAYSGQEMSVVLNNSTQEDQFVDDYKLQPVEAQTTSYVYDNKNLRLLATIDDRNFALIYQYDLEGKLVRKLVETERGVKTLSETQYNIPEKTK